MQLSNLLPCEARQQRLHFLSLVTGLFALLLYIPAQAAESLPSLSPILQAAMPAIVNVAVQGILPGQDFASDEEEANNQNQPAPMPLIPMRPKKFQSIGSGVILNPQEGILITNDHVVRHASLIMVTLQDGRRLKAQLIGSDPETDLAILKVEPKNLKTLPMGDSDKVEVGDFVIAIGNPFGLNSYGNSQSATFGIVSAIKRSDLNIEGVENFIQTDAAINPGNSGGALINTKGELVGINTAIISGAGGGSIGIGFAIPINMVRDVVQQLLKFGSIHRGLMGIFVQPLTPELSQAMGYSDQLQGALIAQVNEGSPAEKAGLKAGDIITKINQTTITQAAQVKTVISLLRVGSHANINIMRNKKAMALDAVVTDLKQHEQALQSSNPFLYGLTLKNFEQDSPIHGHIVGIQMVAAAETSAGWRAGLRPGDVIISANREPTHTVKALQTIAQHHQAQLLVQVLRGPGALFLIIQ